MSQYRIVLEIEASGRRWYYTQYKFCRLFWRYHHTAFPHRNRWPTLGAAVHDIEMRIAAQNNEKQKAIVKREIIKYPPKQ